MMGEPVGAALEFGVAHDLVLEDQCRGIGRARRLFGDQLMQAAILRIVRRRRVEAGHQRPPLRLAQQRHIRHRPGRIGNDLLQQDP